jgi:hypothetical protein
LGPDLAIGFFAISSPLMAGMFSARRMVGWWT